MIKFKHIRFLIEAYRDRLKQKGVSQIIVDYVEALNPAEKGKAISKLMANPKLGIDDLRVEDIRIKDNIDHMRVLDADPTVTVRNITVTTEPGDYYRIIKKWYWEADGSIMLPEDGERVRLALEYYNENKRRFKTTYISKYERFQELEQEYLELSGQKNDSKRQEIRDIKMEGSTKLHDGPEWRVYAITTEEAACHYGKGTQWCTASTGSHNYADHYLQNGPLYIFINKETNEKYQTNHDFTMMMDAQDREIDNPSESPTDILGVAIFIFSQDGHGVTEDLGNALEVLMSANGNEYFRSPTDMEVEMYLERLESDDFWIGAGHAKEILLHERGDYEAFSHYEDRLEAIIASDGEVAVEYAIEMNNRYGEPEGDEQPYRFHEAEAVILRSSQSIIDYASDVLKARWPEGEKVLLSMAERSDSIIYLSRYFEYVYAQYEKSRWIEAEDLLKQDTRLYRKYASFLKKSLDIDIMDDAFLQYMIDKKDLDGLAQLAVHTYERRIPEFEELFYDHDGRISSNLGSIVAYVSHFNIEIPELIHYWIEHFPDHSSVPIAVLSYAQSPVMSGKRDATIEAYLMDYTITAIFYAKDVLKAPWTEFEKRQGELLTDKTDFHVETNLDTLFREYISYFQQRVHPDLEEVIGGYPQYSSQYALQIVKGKYPTEKGHKRIVDVTNIITQMPGSHTMDYLGKYGSDDDYD